jgi:hypothetical protein
MVKNIFFNPMGYPFFRFSVIWLFIFYCQVFLFDVSLFGQDFLEGSWKGKYTFGIYSEVGYPCELFLRIEGRKITGRSYLLTPDNKKVEMDIKGYLFQDLSFIIEETALIKSPEIIQHSIFRKYQLRFKGDIWVKNLEGYWQEITENNFDKARKVGKVLLTKERDNKA